MGCGGDLEGIRQVITDVEDGWGSYFADIKLEDPADNGGPTQTCALMRGSPAINFGDTDFLESIMTTDQRGQGYPRIIGGTVDCGAYEYQPPSVLPLLFLILDD